jgi:O-acetyl-ADP-ribose deacetylase (regulator of RNase III)
MNMGRIEILRGDITLLSVDAIVNAANRSLLGGGGVDGAIHRAAGAELLKSCQSLNGCNTGQAKITPGFRLPSKYVIHTVGPVWKHHEKEFLSSCYLQSLLLALENKIPTIAFPNISTGVYGFPKLEAASIAIETVHNFLKNHPEIQQVIFCCFDEENFSIYNNLMNNYITIEKVQSQTAIQITAKLAIVIWNERLSDRNRLIIWSILFNRQMRSKSRSETKATNIISYVSFRNHPDTSQSGIQAMNYFSVSSMSLRREGVQDWVKRG